MNQTAILYFLSSVCFHSQYAESTALEYPGLNQTTLEYCSSVLRHYCALGMDDPVYMAAEIEKDNCGPEESLNFLFVYFGPYTATSYLVSLSRDAASPEWRISSQVERAHGSAGKLQRYLSKSFPSLALQILRQYQVT